MTTEKIPPTVVAAKEALALAGDLLADIELSRVNLEAAILKASRLARLLNDDNARQAFEYEANGYPTTTEGVPSEAFTLACWAGRSYEKKDEKTKDVNTYIDARSVGSIESSLRAAQQSLSVSADPNISVSSANPNQIVHTAGNWYQRNQLQVTINAESARLSSRRAVVHRYVSEKYYELRYSAIPSEVFSRIRERVDAQIGNLVPAAIKQFTSVYENLASDNPEDWSNAVHSCRRILQSLADAIYPARSDVVKIIKGKSKTIAMGADAYINRLVAFVEEQSSSERFSEIVGSHLGFLGDRLDSIFRANQKGSHANVGQEEADRYVVYTYLVVGDLLTLISQPSSASHQKPDQVLS